MIPLTNFMSFDIYPLCLAKGKYRPIIQNWRGSEPIKVKSVFDTPEEAIAAAKVKIEEYFYKNKGII
jgi:hypothetical protein